MGVGSRFHILRTRTHFPWHRGRSIPISCFVLPDMFSAVPSASGPVFMFCDPVLVFGDTEGVRFRFHVLRSRTRFRRYRGRQLPFSCIARPYSFSAVPRGSGPVFIFCTPRLNFGGTEGVVSRFHVLRSRTRFRRYGGRRVPFSCFARPDLFSAETRASGPIFKLCAPRIISRGTVGVGSRFQVLRTRTHFLRYQGRRNRFFLFCAPGLIFGGTEGVRSRFDVLRS
jgi:hypothetical protein